MRWAGWLIALLAAAATPAFATVKTSTLSAADAKAFADAVVPAKMNTGRIPGALFVVVHRGQVLLSAGYGLADIEKNIPADAQTLFRVGSVSKVVTATAMMVLREAGKLDLDKDITEVDLRRRFPEAVTPRNLLTHTSGFDVSDIEDATHTVEEVLPLDTFVRTRMTEQFARPGELYRYTNHGYALLGRIAELADQRPFAEVVRARVFDPLGMKSSTFEQPAPDALRARLAVGYDLDDDDRYRALPMDYSNVAPADALLTTADDMAAFMIAHLSPASALLRPETIAEMHARHFSNHPLLPGRTLGFEEELIGSARTKLGARRLVSHTGGQLGFTSELLLYPEQELGLFMVLNRREWSVRAEVFREFLARFFPGSDTSIGSSAEAPSPALEGKYEKLPDSAMTVEAVFDLIMASSVDVSISDDGSALVGSVRMKPIAKDAFVSEAHDTHAVFRGDYLVFDGRTYVRGDWRTSLMLHRMIWLIATLFFFAGILFWPLMRRRHRRMRAETPAEQRAGQLAWRLSVINFAYVVLLAVALVGVGLAGGFDYGMSPLMIFVLWLPLLSAVLTIGALFVAVKAWRQNFWNVALRLALTLSAIVSVLLLAVAYHWNLIGS